MANLAAIEARAAELVERRGQDPFLALVLEGSFRVARDLDNPIRGNLCAAGLREAFGHILHGLSPDADVRACHWFVQARDTRTVTRQQRVSYIAHAGLSPDYVESVLGLDPRVYRAPIAEAVDEMNRRAHVRSNTVLLDDGEIRDLAEGVLHAIGQLLDAVPECRSAVEEKLQAEINRAVFDEAIKTAHPDLDELSTHTMVEEVHTEEVTVVDLGIERIKFAVSGSIYVSLNYGSSSDFRNGDGASMSDNYPFKTTLSSSVEDPSAIDQVAELEVDNSSFYE